MPTPKEATPPRFHLDPHFPFRPASFPFFYGWWILAIGTLGVLATFPGQTGGVSVFTDVLIEGMNLSRLQISIAYLIGTTVSGLLLPWGGHQFDRFGARLTAAASALFLGLSVVLLANSDRLYTWTRPQLPSEWHLAWALFQITVAFFLIRFFGQGMLFVASRSMIAKWFDRRRGMMLSLSGVVVSLMFSGGPKFLHWLNNAIGWRETWHLMAMTLLVVFAAALLFFRDNPEECGLEMDGGPTKGPPRPVHSDRKIVHEYSLGEALRTYAFWVFTAGIMLPACILTGFTFHVLSVARDFEVNSERLLSIFLVSAVVSIPTSLLSGWASDHTRIRYFLSLMMGMLSWFCVLICLLPSKWAFYAAAITFGLGMGNFGLLQGVVYPRFFGRTHLGAISGLSQSLIVLASAVGPLLLSLSFEWLGGYRPAFLLSAGISAVLFAMSFFAENPQRKRIVAQESAGKAK